MKKFLNLPNILGLVLGLIAATIIAVVTIKSVNASLPYSSTAALGYFVVPIIAVVFFVPGFIYGWLLGQVIDCIRKPKPSLLRIIGALVCTALLIVTTTYGVRDLRQGLHARTQLATILQANSQQLDLLFKQYHLESEQTPYRAHLLAAITQNPNASSALLLTIAKMPDHVLKMEDSTLYELQGNNKEWLSTPRLIVANPNCNAEIISYLLKHHPDTYLDYAIARSKKSPPSVLRELAKRNNTSINRIIAYNPNTPKDILMRLGNSQDKRVKVSLANNPATPRVILEKLSRDQDKRISKDAKKLLR